MRAISYQSLLLVAALGTLTAAAPLQRPSIAYTIRFAKILKAPSFAASRPYARALLKASVLYLPLLLIIMMLDATAGRR